MKHLLLFFLFILATAAANAGKITGTVTDSSGKIIPYASIQVKGTSGGTSTNSEGRYILVLPNGNYTIICQHVGYRREEVLVRVGAEDIVLDFVLNIQELMLSEIIVKQGEDPAYEIIRNAINKRNFYREQVKEFQVEVYTKGQMKLKDFPKKVLGRKVDLDDTSKNQLIYLSETIATYSYREPTDMRVEIHSSRVSGQSNGYGLAAPQPVSFYENNIQLGTNLNPRGFVSPIAASALGFYNYKYEGTFIEDGKEVNRIRVIPRRKFEPVFQGYINIIENEWRIHSLNLMLTAESQMQFVDTLRIEQLHMPVNADVWFVKSQVIYPVVKFLGFYATGNFANVYSKFNMAPAFKPGFFDNTIIKYLDSSNKKDSVYWETTRPIPLLAEEVKDYKTKDSLEIARKDPRYLDSLDRRSNKFKVFGFITGGHSISKRRTRTFISVNPLIEMIKFNTVEGLVLHPTIRYFHRIDSGMGRKAISITPSFRYGFSNNHLNAYLSAGYQYGKKYLNAISVSGGKRVFQFYNQSLQGEGGATFAVLLFERNRRKIYEAWYARLGFSKALGEGFSWSITPQYQDRIPLENTTDYTWVDKKNISFTPNYPEEFIGPAFTKHQAFSVTTSISWRPGTRYVEFPDRKFSIGSKYPLFVLTYVKGINDVFGSDVDYDRWRFAMSDNINLKLLGRFNYNISTGGFLNARKVQVPDYFHLNGNTSELAANYLTSFQMLPHYKMSNIKKWSHVGFVEYHLNGLITNKIPVIKKLNWHLVTGANAFYSNPQMNHYEIFAGLENIFRIIRVDYVKAFQNGRAYDQGIRFSIGGITAGRIDD